MPTYFPAVKNCKAVLTIEDSVQGCGRSGRECLAQARSRIGSPLTSACWGCLPNPRPSSSRAVAMRARRAHANRFRSVRICPSPSARCALPRPNRMGLSGDRLHCGARMRGYRVDIGPQTLSGSHHDSTGEASGKACEPSHTNRPAGKRRTLAICAPDTQAVKCSLTEG